MVLGVITLALVLASSPLEQSLRLDQNGRLLALQVARGLGAGPVPYSSANIFGGQGAPREDELRGRLTWAALGFLKAWVMSPEGRAAWREALPEGGLPPVAVRQEALAAAVIRAEVQAQVAKPGAPLPKVEVAWARHRLETFIAARARLEREELGVRKALAQPDEAAFRAQLGERLEDFLAETKGMPFGARLVQRGPVKVFADAELERKPGWWKLCYRAGPGAVQAARAFATQWLSELRAAAP